jgi:cupin 2 domain-containing protein
VSGIDVKNVFDSARIGVEPGHESTDEILALWGLKIERIVSHNHASPPGFWYEQASNEWVMVLSGSAGLRFEDETEARQLKAGDYLLIPARKRHRVDWTSEVEPTIWLAVHFSAEAGRN